MPHLHLDRVSLLGSVGLAYRLRDVSFQVDRGDRLALVGASGSGKTSLLRLLNRLQDPSEGQIYLNQQELRTIPILQLRQQVTLVLQESKLLGMTVREALAYPLQLRRQPPSVIEPTVHHWRERLQIPTDWLERRETELSVGQRQVVAIARALTIQPQVLLLDEPTAALDVGRGDALLAVLRDLAINHSMTIIMANHQLELAQEFCTHVVQLQQGHLLQHAAATDVDWTALRASLKHIEAEQTAEWEE